MATMESKISPSDQAPQRLSTDVNASHEPRLEQTVLQDKGVTGPPRSGRKPSFEETFKIEKPQWNDLWAGILLLVTFAGFVTVSVFAIQGLVLMSKTHGNECNEPDMAKLWIHKLWSNIVVLFTLVLAAAMVLGYLSFTMARLFTKAFVLDVPCVLFTILLGVSIPFFVFQILPPAILALVGAVVVLVLSLVWRRRLPFTVDILGTVADVANKHGHVPMTSFVGGLTATTFAAWFAVTLVGTFVRFCPEDAYACDRGVGGCSMPAVIGVAVFITCAAFWFGEWIKLTIHTTIAGLYGSWYFCSQKPGGIPSGVTRAAFRRAMTYSFGSISLGSLLVTVIHFFRQIAYMILVPDRDDDGRRLAPGDMLVCISRLSRMGTDMVLRFVEFLVQYLNYYACSHIALYGKAFFPAAKDSWRLMKDRGLDMVVSDVLIDAVLTMCSLLVGVTCVVVAAVYGVVTKSYVDMPDGIIGGLAAFSFLVGYQIASIFLIPLRSGVATLFVACAWDPDVLVAEHPALWKKLSDMYPDARQAVMASVSENAAVHLAGQSTF